MIANPKPFAMAFFAPKCNIPLLFALLLVSTSCNQGLHQPAGSASKGNSATSAAGPVTRRALIDALRDLARRAASKDSLTIAGIYSFPMPDSVLSLSMDSASEADKEKNGGLVSQSLFLSKYHHLKYQLRLDGLVSLFHDIDVAGLQKSDTLTYEENPKKRASYELGDVRVTGDTLVYLTFGTNTNSGYRGTKEEEEAADAGAYDHNDFWVFRFDGRGLKLVKQSGAD
jgi:hypothetical protein